MLLFSRFSGCSDVASVISSFGLVQAGLEDQRPEICFVSEPTELLEC